MEDRSHRVDQNTCKSEVYHSIGISQNMGDFTTTAQDTFCPLCLLCQAVWQQRQETKAWTFKPTRPKIWKVGGVWCSRHSSVNQDAHSIYCTCRHFAAVILTWGEVAVENVEFFTGQCAQFVLGSSQCDCNCLVLGCKNSHLEGYLTDGNI